MLQVEENFKQNLPAFFVGWSFETNSFLSVIWLPHSKLWAILGYCVFDLQVARSSVTRLDKNNLVSTDPRTDIHPLGFEPGFNCHVVIHSELPLACSFMP